MAELTFRGVDLRRADKSVWFWIERGWFDDIPTVRGVDTTVPGRAGRTRRNRKADTRPLLLNGRLKAATAADFLALVQEMAAIWDPTLNPGSLVAGDQYRGLASGQTATISARTVNIAPDPAQTPFHRKYSWQLESIANPPAWVLAP